VTEDNDSHRQDPVNVLVTGATGFAGASITRDLVDKGCRVFAIARDEQKLRSLLGSTHGEGVKILSGDLLRSADLESLETQLRNLSDKLDVVVHTVGGGPLTSNRAFAGGIFDLNCKTTSNLAGLLERSGKLKSLRLFVYFSSLAAMGLPNATGNEILYDERSTCKPVLPYEQAKLQAETCVDGLAQNHGLKTVILRFPQIYGGTNDAFMQMIHLIRKGVLPVVRGRIGSLPLVHLRDVVGSTYAVIQHRDRIRENCSVYLVCEGSYSYDQLVELVRDKYSQGGSLKVPYFLMYLGTAVAERVFRILDKPEPLNRRRVVSLTKVRVVDSSKFVNTFQYKFEMNVASFLAGRPS
jgi:nucleoside-diphosphate-sugar epimerase